MDFPDLEQFEQRIKQRGLWTTLIKYFLVLSAGAIVGLFWESIWPKEAVRPQEQTTNTSIVLGNEAAAASAVASLKGAEKDCISMEFHKSIGEWHLNEYYEPDEDGFYCPKSRSAFSSPDIWYREQVVADFENITFTYETRNSDEDTTTPPSFIFSTGQSPRLARFYVPESEPQVVGFEAIYLQATTSPELVRISPPSALKAPILPGTQVELTVRSQVVKGNKVQYTYNLGYISDPSGESVEDVFSYEVLLPTPQPGATKIAIGFGTFKGSCIKPIRYSICE